MGVRRAQRRVSSGKMERYASKEIGFVKEGRRDSYNEAKGSKMNISLTSSPALRRESFRTS